MRGEHTPGRKEFVARVSMRAGRMAAEPGGNGTVCRSWARNLEEGEGQEAVAGYAGHAALNATAVVAGGRHPVGAGADVKDTGLPGAPVVRMQKVAGHIRKNEKSGNRHDLSHHGLVQHKCRAGEQPAGAAAVDKATGHRWRGSQRAGCWAVPVPEAGEAVRSCKPWSVCSLSSYGPEEKWI